MLKKQTIYIIIVIIIAVGIDIFIQKYDSDIGCKDNKANVLVGTYSFDAFVASDNTYREKGLSGKKEIFPNEGMLFVFNKENTPRFWMKEMNFPIDIIWIDENKKIIGVEDDITPESFPNTYSPKSKIKYVLEVGSNSIDDIESLIGSEVFIKCKE